MNNSYVTDMMRKDALKFINEMQITFPGIYANYPLQPAMCIMEEAGEFSGAIRRYKGLARRSGTLKEAAEELADIVISAHIAASVYGIDLEDAIARKWHKIMTRGFKETA